MELPEVKEFLTQNKDSDELKKTLADAGFAPLTTFPDYLDTDEGKKILQPRLDSFFTKGLQTWRDNHLEGEIKDRVEEGIKGRLPKPETEEQKQLRELQQSVKGMEQRTQKAELESYALKYATGKGIDQDLAVHFLGSDEESTRASIDNLDSLLKERDKRVAEQLLKDNGRKPLQTPLGNDQTYKDNPWDSKTFNLTKQMEITREQPDMALKLKAAARV